MTPPKDTPANRRRQGHWSQYAPGTGWGYRYRACLVCGKVWRSRTEKPLLRKGGKP